MPESLTEKARTIMATNCLNKRETRCPVRVGRSDACPGVECEYYELENLDLYKVEYWN